MAKFSTLTFFTTLALGVKVQELNLETITEKAFAQFQATYSKSYDTLAEFNLRKQLWQQTDDLINSNQNEHFKLGHNKFSDWTAEEKQKVFGLKTVQTKK